MTSKIIYTGKTDWSLSQDVLPSHYNRLEGGVVTAISTINSILDDIGDLSGLTTTAKNNLVAAINEVYLAVSNVNFNTPGCLNSGALSGGEANVLSYSGAVITLASGTVLTLSDRTKVTLANPVTLTNTKTGSGNYPLFYYNRGLIAPDNFYVQKTQPTPTGTAIWRDTSKEPFVDKYYDGSAWIGNAYNTAYAGAYTINASTVVGVIQPQFNKNFYDAKFSSDFDAGAIAASGSLIAKSDRTVTASLAGTTSIYFPKDAPKGFRTQSRLRVTTSVANPSLTFYNAAGVALTAANWVNGLIPPLSSTTASYDIFLESKDGGTNIVGRYSTIGI